MEFGSTEISQSETLVHLYNLSYVRIKICYTLMKVLNILVFLLGIVILNYSNKVKKILQTINYNEELKIPSIRKS